MPTIEVESGARFAGRDFYEACSVSITLGPSGGSYRPRRRPRVVMRQARNCPNCDLRVARLAGCCPRCAHDFEREETLRRDSLIARYWLPLVGAFDVCVGVAIVEYPKVKETHEFVGIAGASLGAAAVLIGFWWWGCIAWRRYRS